MADATRAECLRLSLGNEEISVSSASELTAAVSAFLSSRQFAEIWLSKGHAKQMSMLVNGPRAWLMYLVNIDEQCWHTVDPAFPGPADGTTEFVLSNGQLDRYPASWTIPTLQAVAELGHFFTARDRSPHLSWEQ